MKNINNDKYEAFSLVEMLLTIVIIGFVMLISAVTLTTLIKVSTVSSNKTRVRNESEYVLELVRKTVRNSNPSDVFIFNSKNARNYVHNKETNTVTIESTGTQDLKTLYSTPLGENEVGNEIHFRPYGYNSWVCIGYFKDRDSDKGYIVKSNVEDLLNNHESCFASASGKFLISLNSDYVSINSFDIAYTKSPDNNYLIRFDIEAEPVFWYFAKGAPVSKKVLRQTVVKTEGLIW
ncbi:MAG: pilus assembly FimT family protein [Candidatus Dojkabacteria bacterium]|jgi:type II secretory pathway pseudopilin PulG